MLHRIKSHGCEAVFEAILLFQRNILLFAFRSKTATPSIDNFKKFFGGDCVDWLQTLLWYPRNSKNHRCGDPQPLYNALVRLIQYMQSSPKNTQQEILEAFDNDTSFHEHQNDADFQFLFSTLHADTQTTLRPLMERFYTDILNVGFEKILANRFGRDTFTTAFWFKNKTMLICPACDTLRPEEKRERSDEGKETSKVYAQVDHFFPKSVYPFLSVHPYNLVPICSVCNEIYKRNKDPIDNHSAAPLCRCFLPYLRPAKEPGVDSNRDQVEVKISRNARGAAYQVTIEDTSEEFLERVDNLERLFKLSERWATSTWLRSRVVKKVAEHVTHWGGMLRRRGMSCDAQDLRIDLTTLQKDCQRKVGQEQDQILWASYLKSCVLEDDQEFKALLAVFSS